jgi:flagellar secretion chaperone FliS
VTTTGLSTYQRIQVETSSPAGLITLLFDALRTDLYGAETALRASDHERAHARLLRAQEIVMELMTSLDPAGGEIPEQLAALYEYMYRRLVEANLHKDLAIVGEVAKLVEPIAEAWKTAVATAANERGQ